jgi:hypothetical protein
MRIAMMLVDDGIMPPDTDFDRNNTVTQCLAPMLGLEPTGYTPTF